jgi:hypothetical protein
MYIRTMVRYSLALALALSHINSAWPQTTFTVSGTLTGDDGTLPPGAAAVLHRVPEYINASRTRIPRPVAVASTIQAPRLVPVSVAGTFQVTGLPQGRYRLCADVPDGFLDNCGWDTPVDLILAPGSSTTSRAVRVRRGGIVRIRLDDPQGLLTATETSYGERRAKVGVMTPTEAFHAATLRSRDPGGRELLVTVPFDMPLRLWVNPNGVAVQASDGRILSRAGPALTFQVSRLSPSIEFRLRVVPGGP